VEHCGLTKFVGGCELNSGRLEQGLVVGLCSVMSEKILLLSLISQQVLKIDLPHSHICRLLAFLFTNML
jgi:hypothetical protein